MSELVSRVVVLLGGTLYPAYRSYKVRSLIFGP